MKKKLWLFIFCFVILSIYLYGNDRRPFRMPDRSFEIGLLHTNVNFANDFLSIFDIFQETAVIDLGELKDGFNASFGFEITPFYILYNNKRNNWGFGFSAALDLTGSLGLSGNMLSLSPAINDRSSISGAAFTEARFLVYFPVSRLTIRISPAVYYPLLFVQPDVSYTYIVGADSANLDLHYNLRIFTPFSLEDGFAFSMEDIYSFLFSGRPGVDINIGLEYSLEDTHGLILGLNMYNIPVFPGQLSHFMQLEGRIGDSDLNFFDGFDLDNFITIEDIVYGQEYRTVLRPFIMHAWADWRPFRIIPIHFISTAGFAFNPHYLEPFSPEYGLKTRLDLANILIATVGLGYYDRMWRNSVDLAFNLRAFEINFGVDMRSPNFFDIWSGGGLGISAGLKLGW